MVGFGAEQSGRIYPHRGYTSYRSKHFSVDGQVASTESQQKTADSPSYSNRTVFTLVTFYQTSQGHTMYVCGSLATTSNACLVPVERVKTRGVRCERRYDNVLLQVFFGIFAARLQYGKIHFSFLTLFSPCGDILRTKERGVVSGLLPNLGTLSRGYCMIRVPCLCRLYISARQRWPPHLDNLLLLDLLPTIVVL